MIRKHKIPITLNLPVAQQKLYIGYLWFKSLTSSDRLYKKGLRNHKNKAYYWGKKLSSAGLVEDMGTYYRVKGYTKIWAALRVSKVNKEYGGKGWRHTNLDIDQNNFLKDGLTTYHRYLTKRKKRQIVAVVAVTTKSNRRLVSKTKTCRLSCKSVSSLLGYKSDISGHKYRNQFYRVIKPENANLRIVSYSGDNRGIVGCYRMPCYSISLRD